MLEVEKINFQIKGLELTESSFKLPIKKAITDKEVFKFTLNLEHILDPTKDILIVKTHITIIIEDTEEIVGLIQTQVTFNIIGLLNYFTEDKINLPDNFISALNSISISTTRGIMFTTFKGTFLHNATLPLIDPTFKNDNMSDDISS